LQPPVIPTVTITAHLAEAEKPAAAPPPPVAEPQPAKPPPQPEKRRKVVEPEPAPPKPSSFSVAPAPPPPVAEPAPIAEPAPAPVPSVSAPGPVASAPAAPAAPDPSTLIAQYRSQFIGAAARYKRYPLPARDNGWEGDVVVRLEISANGDLAEVKVKRGSGHSALDDQALEMFRLAAPEVPVPAGLRGRAFGFDVRAVYSLKD
jgi:protein TonB